ncbi:competence protein ComEA [Sphaerotilus hippei]|uniref:Competence protein ComEA n=1 Tax=Sphaerotilus hippei TaxID=744406 RepID=A0A318GYK7_9BURK|nr:helix-hairpin-helix domain-containing protein [Sphaerotilus hippei]PXW92264.1 competence protein ComEA [Sphaerotilus hippei]
MWISNFRRLALALSLTVLSLAAQAAAVDVNKGTQADLETVKGVGPGISGKILEERKKGSFRDWADFIDRISGIGPGNAAKLSTAGLTVNGSTYGGTAAPAPVEGKAAAGDKSARSAKAEPSAAR